MLTHKLANENALKAFIETLGYTERVVAATSNNHHSYKLLYLGSEYNTHEYNNIYDAFRDL